MKDAKELRCPACGSLDVHASIPPMGQTLGACNGIGITKEEYRCNNCREVFWFLSKRCFTNEFKYITIHFSGDDHKLLCLGIEEMPNPEDIGYLVEELGDVWRNDKELFYTHNWNKVTCSNCLKEKVRQKYGRKQ